MAIAIMEFEGVGVETWLDKLACYFGFGVIANKIPFNVAPATVAVFSIVVIDLIALDILQILTRNTASGIRNPLRLIIPITILLGVIISRDIERRYQYAIREMQIDQRTDESEIFQNLCGERFRWIIWILGAFVIFINVIFVFTVPTIIGTGGVPGLVRNIVIIPLVYLPVAVEFIAVFIGIQLILPRRIRHSDFELDFLDPEGLGGLRPVGELVKHTYYYFMFGLIAIALFIYGPWVFGGPFDAPVRPSSFINGIFTIAWLVGAVSVAHAFYVFHRFMNEEKRKRLHDLNNQYRDRLENPYNIAEHNIPEDKQEEVEEIKNRMNQITSTKEYPATFSMWTQLLIGIFLPKAFQLVLSYV